MLFGAPLSSSVDLLGAKNLLRQKVLPALLAALCALGLGACQPEAGGGEGDDTSAPPVVDVTAVDYAFQAPDSVRSGWTTLRMVNEGSEHHHFHLLGMPDGRTAHAFITDVLAPADSLGRLRAAGKIDSAQVRETLAQTVPDWARPANIVKGGGVGGVAPGDTGRTTVYLKSGTYVMDCAIRTAEGRVHRALGMVDSLVVTDENTGASPPDPDVTVRVSGSDLRVLDTLDAGTKTVKFRVDRAPDGDNAYFGMLARLKSDVTAEDLVAWDLHVPPPARYLGGFEYIPTSDSAYFTVDLTPGRYAWHWGYFGRDYRANGLVVE
jgi:hypothetical protein